MLTEGGDSLYFGEISLKLEEVFVYGKNWQLLQSYSVDLCICQYNFLL